MHECKYEETIMEMHGDIKAIRTELEAMNGTATDTQKDYLEHKKESDSYRKKIDIMWAILVAVPWVVVFLFGTGVIKLGG